MEGTIKWYNSKKNFGFITGIDGKDYFFHKSALPQGKVPKENDKVNFSPEESERGIQAQNIEFFKEE